MRDGMNGTATFAVQGSAPAVAPLDHFEDGGGLVLESAWSHYQPHYPTASVKQEPVDHDVNNDSGISPGRCTGSSSGSDGPSPDRDNPRPNSNPLPSYPATSQYHTPGRPDSSPAAGYHPHPSLRVSLSVTPNTPSSPSKFLSQIPQDGAATHNTPPPQAATSTQSPLSSGSVMSDHEQYERKNDDMLSQEAEDPLRRLQMALERSDMMGAMKSDKEGSGSLMLQCVVCEFSTTSRSVFHSHVSSHYEPKGEGLSPDEDTDSEEAGLRTPRVNSQGKVKTFRCKQCDFVALTKLEFWEHSRGHIKADKLLTCPKCPFVTEYKHHLEYHLRNHFGSKPFKCDKCSYSCVNKSMLNSHLKSHSNVYQYRCNDCNYATKYCHSLKLHLRKYTHKPAMVLNPDGSPNPLPIIDVYGTRRGPKLRPKSDDSDSQKMSLQHNQQQQQQQPLQQTPILPAQQQQIPPSQLAQFPMFQAFSMLAKPGTNGLPLPFPYGPLMNGAFPPNPSPVPPFPYSNNMRQEESQKDSSDSSIEHSLLAQQLVNVNNNHPEQEGMKDYLARVITSRQLQIPRFPDFNSQYYQEEVKTPSNPLDLSKPIAFDMPPVFPNSIQNNNNNNNSNTNNNNTTNSGTKNRRKGKAYKLERISISVPQESDDEVEELPPAKIQKLDDEQENETKDNPLLVTETEGKEMDDGKGMTTSEVTSEESIQHNKDDSQDEAGDKVECYNCNYCDITFKDIVMYTMHMGYHGYQDPFKCNMCGQQTTDRVNFFLHIARSSHY